MWTVHVEATGYPVEWRSACEGYRVSGWMMVCVWRLQDIRLNDGLRVEATGYPTNEGLRVELIKDEPYRDWGFDIHPSSALFSNGRFLSRLYELWRLHVGMSTERVYAGMKLSWINVVGSQDISLTTLVWCTQTPLIVLRSSFTAHRSPLTSISSRQIPTHLHHCCHWLRPYFALLLNVESMWQHR